MVKAASQETAAKEGSPNDLNRVEDHPDEYLIDGGDRALPIHYDRFNRQGLDTEDTVAEYVDHLGRRHVKPTNRVAIYAPRFGAVRSVTTPTEGTTTALVASTEDHVGRWKSWRLSGRGVLHRPSVPGWRPAFRPPPPGRG